MQFTAKEDVEIPIEEVFRMISDFGAMERAALRRGIEVRRTSPAGAAPGPGMGWHVAFQFRGKPREASLKLVGFDAPNAMRFESESGGIEAEGGVELVALSRTRTRMTTEIALEAKTLSARLILQSLKLARSNLAKRFKLRVAHFAKELEDRYSRTS